MKELPCWKGLSISKCRQLASCRGWKETAPIKRETRQVPRKASAKSSMAPPEGHPKRVLQGPSSQPQVECFTCQACPTALQPLGLPMRLPARFPAILVTPQEIGCLWTLGLVSTSCRNLHCTFFGRPFSPSGSYSGLVWIVAVRLLFLVCVGSEIDFNQRRISQRRRQSGSAAAFCLLWFLNRLGPASWQSQGRRHSDTSSCFWHVPSWWPSILVHEICSKHCRSCCGYKSLID